MVRRFGVAWRALVGGLLLCASQGLAIRSVAAQSAAAFGNFCQLPPSAAAQDDALRTAALGGDGAALAQYQQLVQSRAAALAQCRAATWPRVQAVWLRLYPCDLQPGVLESALDRIVELGYNRVFVEVFYDGQVLLPVRDNPTVWPSVVRTPGAEDADLLARAIQLGRARGLSVYAWMFALNFGYSYGQRPDRQEVLARNGARQTSLNQPSLTTSSAPDAAGTEDQVFVDPYSPQARADLAQLVQAIVQRRPDGVLFDYIRYPKGSGAASVVSSVQGLWIYGPASWTQLFGRARNGRGQDLLNRFLRNGFITANDLQATARQYPNDTGSLWQTPGGRPVAQPSPPTAAPLQASSEMSDGTVIDIGSGAVNVPGLAGPRQAAVSSVPSPALPATPASPPPSAQEQARIQRELWQLVVAHARQGVLDFLSSSAQPVLQQRLSAGAVFFPEANRAIGKGFDSRLQPWEQFPAALEWHAMAYGICGNTSCIVDQVGKVLTAARPGTQVVPALAGVWGQAFQGRPSLDQQMQALQQTYPNLNAVSHFAYSWLEPQSDYQRKTCRVR